MRSGNKWAEIVRKLDSFQFKAALKEIENLERKNKEFNHNQSSFMKILCSFFVTPSQSSFLELHKALISNPESLMETEFFPLSVYAYFVANSENSLLDLVMPNSLLAFKFKLFIGITSNSAASRVALTAALQLSSSQDPLATMFTRTLLFIENPSASELEYKLIQSYKKKVFESAKLLDFVTSRRLKHQILIMDLAVERSRRQTKVCLDLLASSDEEDLLHKLGFVLDMLVSYEDIEPLLSWVVKSLVELHNKNPSIGSIKLCVKFLKENGNALSFEMVMSLIDCYTKSSFLPQISLLEMLLLKKKGLLREHLLEGRNFPCYYDILIQEVLRVKTVWDLSLVKDFIPFLEEELMRQMYREIVENSEGAECLSIGRILLLVSIENHLNEEPVKLSFKHDPSELGLSLIAECERKNMNDDALSLLMSNHIDCSRVLYTKVVFTIWRGLREYPLTILRLGPLQCHSLGWLQYYDKVISFVPLHRTSPEHVSQSLYAGTMTLLESFRFSGVEITTPAFASAKAIACTSPLTSMMLCSEGVLLLIQKFFLQGGRFERMTADLLLARAREIVEKYGDDPLLHDTTVQWDNIVNLLYFTKEQDIVVDNLTLKSRRNVSRQFFENKRFGFLQIIYDLLKGVSRICTSHAIMLLVVHYSIAELENLYSGVIKDYLERDFSELAVVIKILIDEKDCVTKRTNSLCCLINSLGAFESTNLHPSSIARFWIRDMAQVLGAIVIPNTKGQRTQVAMALKATMNRTNIALKIDEGVMFQNEMKKTMLDASNWHLQLITSLVAALHK